MSKVPILHFLWGKWDRDGRYELMYRILRFILGTNAIGESIKIDMMRKRMIFMISSGPEQCAYSVKQGVTLLLEKAWHLTGLRYSVSSLRPPEF